MNNETKNTRNNTKIQLTGIIHTTNYREQYTILVTGNNTQYQLQGKYKHTNYREQCKNTS
jgi:hypothetical protein